MAPMVEADRDGRLDARERSSLARHLAACESCRTLVRDLDRLRDMAVRPRLPPVTELEHQRGRLALLRAGVTMGSQSTLGAPTPGPVEPAPQATGATLAPSDPAPQATGEQKSARTETRVTGAEDARFERSSAAGVERVELSEGAVDLEVRPLGVGERFLVATGDAEVEVRGTV